MTATDRFGNREGNFGERQREREAVSGLLKHRSRKSEKKSGSLNSKKKERERKLVVGE